MHQEPSVIQSDGQDQVSLKNRTRNRGIHMTSIVKNSRLGQHVGEKVSYDQHLKTQEKEFVVGRDVGEHFP